MTQRLLNGACIGLAIAVSTSVMQYVDNAYELDWTYTRILLSLGLPASLALIGYALSHWRTRHHWVNILLWIFFSAEIILYSIGLSYSFSPCNWLDLPRRMSGCVAASIIPREVAAQFFHADTTFGVLLDKNMQLPPWMAADTQSPAAEKSPSALLSVAPDNSRTAIGRENGQVDIRQPQDGALMATIAIAVDKISSVLFTADGQSLLVADKTPMLHLCRIREQTCSTALVDQIGIRASAITSDATLLATIGGNQTIRVWNWPTRTLKYTLIHPADVTTIAFSPDSRYLVSADWSGQIRLWRTSDGALLYYIQAYPDDSIEQVVFSPDGTLFASNAGYHTQNLRIWSTTTGMLLQTFDQKYAATISFSSDGRFLFASGLDRMYRWQVP
jgi:hypothetical protein